MFFHFRSQFCWSNSVSLSQTWFVMLVVLRIVVQHSFRPVALLVMRCVDHCCRLMLQLNRDEMSDSYRRSEIKCYRKRNMSNSGDKKRRTRSAIVWRLQFLSCSKKEKPPFECMFLWRREEVMYPRAECSMKRNAIAVDFEISIDVTMKNINHVVSKVVTCLFNCRTHAKLFWPTSLWSKSCTLAGTSHLRIAPQELSDVF